MVFRPCMEYASHIWGGSTHTVLLEKMESRAFRFINSPNSSGISLILSSLFLPVELLRHFLYTIAITTDTTLPTSHRIAPPLRRVLAISYSTHFHSFSVQVSDPRLNLYAQSYMYFTGKVLNTFPLFILPTFYEMHTFKCRESGHVAF